MTSLSLTATLSIFCSTLVGAVFLLTGCIKALAPSSAIRFFAKLGVTNWKHLRVVVWVSAVAECVLGTALMARAFPSWLFPGAIVLLIAFVVLTAWNAKK